MRRLAILLLLCQAIGAAQARVRLVIDLKKQFGYEIQNQFGDSKKRWKDAHGITFLTNDVLLLYQVHRARKGKNGPPEPYYVQVNLIDARDGHETGKLRVPANEPRAFAAATHGGGFLLTTGGTLYSFSADLQQRAAKAFTLLSGGAPEDWEMSVTPSGKAVVLVHHYNSSESKTSGTTRGLTGLQGEVELLNADNLAPIRGLTVTRLHGWSVGEDYILTKDPKTAMNSRAFGILEWNGQWTPLHTAVEKTDCYFLMHVLQDDRIVAFDCDELTVITRTGDELFSFPAAGRDIVTSIASEGDYLAASFFSVDELDDALSDQFSPEPRGEYVMLFDIRKKATLFRVHADGLAIRYAVSSEGTLAVVDGTRLKIFERKE